MSGLGRKSEGSSSRSEEASRRRTIVVELATPAGEVASATSSDQRILEMTRSAKLARTQFFRAIQHLHLRRLDRGLKILVPGSLFPTVELTATEEVIKRIVEMPQVRRTHTAPSFAIAGATAALPRRQTK